LLLDQGAAALDAPVKGVEERGMEIPGIKELQSVYIDVSQWHKLNATPSLTGKYNVNE